MKNNILINKWNEFPLKKYSIFEQPCAPYDGQPFIALIWGNDNEGGWVGMGIYRRHYDADHRLPGKYEFFYVTENPEEEGWKIPIEKNPFPITHWMPLPKSKTAQ